MKKCIAFLLFCGVSNTALSDVSDFYNRIALLKEVFDSLDEGVALKVNLLAMRDITNTQIVNNRLIEDKKECVLFKDDINGSTQLPVDYHDMIKSIVEHSNAGKFNIGYQDMEGFGRHRSNVAPFEGAYPAKIKNAINAEKFNIGYQDMEGFGRHRSNVASLDAQEKGVINLRVFNVDYQDMEEFGRHRSNVASLDAQEKGVINLRVFNVGYQDMEEFGRHRSNVASLDAQEKGVIIGSGYEDQAFEMISKFSRYPSGAIMNFNIRENTVDVISNGDYIISCK